MTETQIIVEAYRQAGAENVRAALATVLRVEGSAYRRAGARMVVTETGQTTGFLISGEPQHRRDASIHGDAVAHGTEYSMPVADLSWPTTLA